MVGVGPPGVRHGQRSANVYGSAIFWQYKSKSRSIQEQSNVVFLLKRLIRNRDTTHKKPTIKYKTLSIYSIQLHLKIYQNNIIQHQKKIAAVGLVSLLGPSINLRAATDQFDITLRFKKRTPLYHVINTNPKHTQHNKQQPKTIINMPFHTPLGSNILVKV